MKTQNHNKMEWIYLTVGLLTVVLLSGLLSSCAVVKTDYSNATKKEATVYYYLPESIIKIRATAKVAVVYDDAKKFTGSNKVIEQNFTVTSEMIADTGNLLSLNYKSNCLSADDIQYGVNSKGLLETVNITTEDRTADIISKLAEAPQVILGSSTNTLRAANTSVTIKEFSADFVLKASDLSTTAKVINWNIIILNELGVNEPAQSVPADFSVTSGAGPLAATPLSKLIGGPANATEVDGILTRPIKNISLVIQSAVAHTDLSTPLPINVVVADASKLIVIPVKRTPFVKRVNKIGLQDGLIVSNEINNPSSVEGFVSIPVNVAKAIVSIPGQLIQFRYDNTKRAEELEKAKLSYEKSLQESQKFALTKEQELEKVKLEMDKNELTNSIELQKVKLELQTSLLEAETKQLEAQKALDDIKKQLEALKPKKPNGN